MSLSEGKMFTIEALNRIEGFEWPEGSEFAGLGCNTAYMAFWASVPIAGDKNFRAFLDEVCVGTEHPDWRNSLITREEFESVDGWVRNDGSIPDVGGVFDVKFNDGITVKGESKVSDYNWPSTDDNDSIAFWRYHKPQKQEVKPEPENNTSDQSESREGIESLISKHKAVKEIARLARIELERVEAAEHSLMLSIEAWAESHGFDIRVLSESEEKPDMVITDFGDLRIGDEIECIHPVGGFISPGDIGVVTSNDGELITADFDKQSDYVYGDSNFGIKFKFIRRPEKK